MAVFNKIGEFIEKQSISRYRFWQDTQLGRDTAYRLCNDPSYIPTGSVLDKICSTYRIQPGDILGWYDDSGSEELTLSSAEFKRKKTKDNINKNDEADDESEKAKLIKIQAIYPTQKVS